MTSIIFYTQPDCPPCEITKTFLKEYGFSYELKDIKADPKARKELIEVYQSYSTPTLVIGEEIITGFNLERLKEVLKIENK
ncbi:glutaredoxin family protein [Cytobacillus gottheilii]|uniref:glutaredoxin family protein n=1 Tax=Cytobacillus gottheilii TaxID=859144 RepID=UPI0009BA992E|nr:glutaredoxin family protein [Cytobacillus gottheilii]